MTMKIITLYLNSVISWLSSQDDAPTAAFSSLSGAKLINPSYYNHQALSQYLSFDQSPGAQPPLLIDGDKWVVSSNRLCFVLDEGQTLELNTFSSKFLRTLRYISGQAWIPRILPVITEQESVSIPDFKCAINPKTSPGHAAFIRAQYVDLAMPWSEIHQLDEALKQNNFETYREVLLDGIAAHQEGDYLKAILYSAIACESVAAQQIDRAYDDLRKAPVKHATHRFVKQRTPTGDVEKDPVFERLRSFEKGAFLSSLHELPLYLWARSLQDDNPQLYRTAHALYKTRNKIAHLGGLTEESEKILPITSDGSQQALDCAVGVFDWFGVDAKQLLPRNEMLRVFMTG